MLAELTFTKKKEREKEGNHSLWVLTSSISMLLDGARPVNSAKKRGGKNERKQTTCNQRRARVVVYTLEVQKKKRKHTFLSTSRACSP